MQNIKEKLKDLGKSKLASVHCTPDWVMQMDQWLTLFFLFLLVCTLFMYNFLSLTLFFFFFFFNYNCTFTDFQKKISKLANQQKVNPNPKLWEAVATPAYIQRIKDCLALPKALPLESPAFFRHPKCFVDQLQWPHDKVLLSTITTLGVALLEGWNHKIKLYLRLL